MSKIGEVLSALGYPRQKRREIWMDVLCMVAIAMGLCIAFDQAFRFHAPIWHIALSVCVTIGVMWACHNHHGWLLLGVLSAVTVALAVFILVFGWDTVWLHIFGFLDWWVKLFPRDSIYNLQLSIILVQTLIHIGLAIVTWIYVRVVRSGLMLALSAAVFLCVLYFSGFPKLFWPTIMLTAGVFPLFSRNFYDRGRRKGRNATKELFSRLRLQILVVCLCLVVMLGLLVVVPTNTDNWIVADMYVGFHDLLDALGLQVPEENHFSFESLYSLGLTREEWKLGGNISPDDTTPLLRVNTPIAAPLRGLVYDVYTGTEWKNSTDYGYKFNSRASYERRDGVFNIDLPAENFTFNLDQNLGNISMRVVQYSTTSTMFVADRVTSVQLLDLPRVNVMFNNRSEVFANQINEAGFAYEFTADLRFQRASKKLYNDMNGLVRRVRNEDDPYWVAVCERYLQLPDSLPSGVRDKAAELILPVMESEMNTEYAKAVALETYLRSQEFTYTQKPGNVPTGVDFVEHFLTTKKGYCTYFATAMVVMARSQGIPARMVVGYALDAPDDDTGTNYLVYQSDAHAWVECYFKGLGWIAFDPTAGSDALYLYDPAYDEDIETEPVTTEVPETVPVTEEDPEEITEDPDSVDVDTETEGETEDERLYRELPVTVKLAWLGAMLLVVLLIGVLGRLLYVRICYIPAYAIKSFRRKRISNFYYKDFLRQYRHLGFKLLPGETLAQFERRLASLGYSDEDVKRLFDFLCGWKYNAEPVTEKQVWFLGHMHGRLELLVRKRMNPFKYVVLRVILSL